MVYKDSSDHGLPVDVVFQLGADLEQATIHCRYLWSEKGMEAPMEPIPVSLRRDETVAETLRLDVGRYVIHLPSEKNLSLSPTGTTSGTIEVSGTPTPEH